MQYFKLQIGCMLIVLYVAFIYIREKYEYKVKQKEPVFELLLITGILSIAFDGATAYTVNYLDKVPGLVNAVLHACFLCGLDTLSFVIFLYMYDITRGVPKSRKIKTLIILPLAICIAVVILFMPQLEYRPGRITNYSMGISAYTCFIMVAVYMLGTVILLVKGWRNMGHHKLITLTTCIAAANVVTIYQMIYPESLISCLVPTFVIIGSYLNVENPLFTKLQAHNREMVMGFATLVENRDGSTGGHIRRTTTYVKLLAEELQKRGMYKEQLTQDYIENLTIAAPMHDVGKIAIPDAILQKPGRLTDEEFAMYHHEKWNGKGYPQGLTGEQIPLCARIMSVADVFDAVSAKRCYRGAMPLEQCFEIIEKGSGQDFDPQIAEVFLDMRERIGQVVGTI